MPGLLAQHADCILLNGAPGGFYGGVNAGSSGGGSSGSGATSRKRAATSNSSGFGMTGVVFDADAMALNRANCIDRDIAKVTGRVSTLLLVHVSAAEAAALDKAWADLSGDPDLFRSWVGTARPTLCRLLFGPVCSAQVSLVWIHRTSYTGNGVSRRRASFRPAPATSGFRSPVWGIS